MRFALLVLNDCLGDRCVGFHIHARCGCGLKTQRRRVIEPRNTLESRAVGLSPGSSGSGNARRRYRVYLWFYSCPYGGEAIIKLVASTWFSPQEQRHPARYLGGYDWKGFSCPHGANVSCPCGANAILVPRLLLSRVKEFSCPHGANATHISIPD